MTASCHRLTTFFAGYERASLLSYHPLRVEALMIRGAASASAVAVLWTASSSLFLTCVLACSREHLTTQRDGSVDSHIDEQRSKLRYLPRIADALSGELWNA